MQPDDVDLWIFKFRLFGLYSRLHCLKYLRHMTSAGKEKRNYKSVEPHVVDLRYYTLTKFEKFYVRN